MPRHRKRRVLAALVWATLCSALLLAAGGCSAEGGPPSLVAEASSTTTGETSSAPTVAAPTVAEPISAIVAKPATVVRVVDGDTAVFRFGDGKQETVRFIGVNTPESTTKTEPYGKEASAYTTKQLAGKKVFLETDAELRDKYQRLLAYVWFEAPTEASDAEIRAKMFNARLLLDGYAQQMTIQPDSKYASFFTTYVREAEQANKGLWNPALVAKPAPPPPKPKPKLAAPAPAPQVEYIGNRNTHKLHYPDCSSVSQMNESNKVAFSSRQAAIDAGYVPCKRCNP